MFNEMMDEVSRTTKKISSDVQKTVDVGRLKSKIKKEEYKIESCYKEIGRIYFENLPEEVPELFAESVEAIQSCNMEIKKLSDELCKLRGVAVCDECGEELADNMKFCPQCGAKREVEVVSGDIVDMDSEEIILKDTKKSEEDSDFAE